MSSTVGIAKPWPNTLLADCLADAEREVNKLRRLLVVRLCNCRPMATTLPLEPCLHAPTCIYRKEMQ
jgi:hypothetical protein